LKIAVIGSGGREHAILWRLARDSDRHALFALPGNGGTSAIARNVPVDAGNVEQLLIELEPLAPDLVVVGPEVPLALGLADDLHAKGINCFGPSAAAARIECSKVFSKELMRKCGVPTAEFEVFRDFEFFQKFIKHAPEGSGWVVKADGLAAGKGAFVCSTVDEALMHAHTLLVDGSMGDAGKAVVLERKLSGREVSALYLCDGEAFTALPAAQDYKRANHGDHGPNTGGMGSFCPASQLTDVLRLEVEKHIIAPILRALAEDGAPYQGVLYAGLMLTDNGPQVIEFNCRFGDPETQVILPILQGEFSEILLACAQGRLSATSRPAEHPENAAVCVVLAAEGYPDKYEKAIPLVSVADAQHAFTFHAGTAFQDGKFVSNGGRVLNAVGTGPTVGEAREQAYGLAAQLKVPGLRFRFDIARGI
jgi:phosphoribosylamine---glycine ligase